MKAIHQCMCTDEDDVPNGPKNIWMDVDADAYEGLMARDDMRGRVVYTFDDALPDGSLSKSTTKRVEAAGGFDRARETSRRQSAVEKLLRLGYHYDGTAWVMQPAKRYKITSPPGPAQTHTVVQAYTEAEARGEAAVRSSVFEDSACTCELLDPNVKWCKVCQIKPCVGGFDHCCQPGCIPF